MRHVSQNNLEDSKTSTEATSQTIRAMGRRDSEEFCAIFVCRRESSQPFVRIHKTLIAGPEP